EPSGPGQAALEPGRVSELAKGEVVVGVPAAYGVGFVASIQELVGVLADRLQHPEAALRVPEQAFVNERLQGVEVRVHDLLSRLERAAAAEDGHPGEGRLLVGREQVVRP